MICCGSVKGMLLVEAGDGEGPGLETLMSQEHYKDAPLDRIYRVRHEAVGLHPQGQSSNKRSEPI